MTASRLLPAAVLAALVACAHPQDATDPHGAATPTAGAASSAGAPVLPPIDLTCTVDGDCALIDLKLTGPDACCPVCGLATAGRADSIRAVRAACAAHTDWTAQCLPPSCPVGVDRAVCKDRRCVTVQ